MAAAAKRPDGDAPKRRSPARSPQAVENRLIALATDLAEQQLRDGTASAQVQVHYLKLATAREGLERKKLEAENRLLAAKVDQLATAGESEKLAREAINAFRAYSGAEPGNDQ